MQIYLSRVIKRKDLAKLLTDAYKLRITYNYRMDMKASSDVNDVEKFMNEILKPFISEIDKLIKEKS